MLINYLKTAFRLLVRQKSYSFINIGGLAIGMSVCILILSYVFFELSYDKFHENPDQIYRVGVDATVGGNTMNLAVTSGRMSEALREDFPEVLENTRFSQSGTQDVIIGDHKFIQDDFLYVDSSFLNVFSFEMVQGLREEALLHTRSVVLTEKTANKFFGERDPMGEMIKINATNYKVTGVLKNVPPNSTVQFEMLVGMDINDQTSPFYGMNNWGNISMYSYVKLEKNTDYKALEEKFDDFKVRHTQQLIDMGVHFDLFLQPITMIHLYSNLEREGENSGDITYVYLFSAIAIFILFIACINYMNLASARSFKRAKEVGMRKIHGAVRPQLIRQFLGESVFFSINNCAINDAIVQ